MPQVSLKHTHKYSYQESPFRFWIQGKKHVDFILSQSANSLLTTSTQSCLKVQNCHDAGMYQPKSLLCFFTIFCEGNCRGGTEAVPHSTKGPKRQDWEDSGEHPVFSHPYHSATFSPEIRQGLNCTPLLWIQTSLKCSKLWTQGFVQTLRAKSCWVGCSMASLTGVSGVPILSWL